jgi:hypothetical protein
MFWGVATDGDEVRVCVRDVALQIRGRDDRFGVAQFDFDIGDRKIIAHDRLLLEGVAGMTRHLFNSYQQQFYVIGKRITQIKRINRFIFTAVL